MKTLLNVVSAMALLSTFALAESAATNQERVEVQNEVQNKFRTMSTNELLEKRGTMMTQQEREQLHNELMSRQQTMTKEQKEKFMKRPENRIPKKQNQGGGMGSGMSGGMGKGGR